MIMISRTSRYPFAFTLTLDERLNDLLVPYCMEKDINKTDFCRMLIARHFGIKNYDINRIPGETTTEGGENNGQK